MSKSPDSLDYAVVMKYQDERFESPSEILVNQVETIPCAPVDSNYRSVYQQHPGVAGHLVEGSQSAVQQYPPLQEQYFQETAGSMQQQYQQAGSEFNQYDQEESQEEQARKRMFDIANQMMTEPYYYWATDESTPITKKEIWAICVDLERIFGFQHDSVTNIFDHFMIQLESRSSRMPSRHALFTLHADYIGGENSNYRKWYFASQIEHDDQFSFLFKKGMKTSRLKNHVAPGFECRNIPDATEYLWRSKMFNYEYHDVAAHVLLYLLIWGEASNIRFMPECLCFIFKCALDYYESVEGKHSTSKPNDFLKRVISPLYTYIRDQQFKLLDGVFIRRERDHEKIIGYDDINQLFWYHDRMESLSIGDGRKLSDIPSSDRYNRLGEIDWNKACYKTYRESRSWWHLAVNFNRIWIIHFSMFWYYSSFNAPTLYTVDYSQLLNNQPTPQARLTIISLGSTVACLIQIMSVLAEFKFIPLSWEYFKYQLARLLVIFITLALNVTPSIFILGWIPLDSVSQLGFSLSICQFILSVFTTLVFSFQPLGNLFGVGGSRYHTYHPNTAFTSSFPKLTTKGSIMSICLWLVVFVSKFTESYFFLTLSVRDPVRNLSILDMSRCHGEAFFGSFLCQYQNIIILFLMMFTDMILFFLDTYLWYIIWNCIFSLTLSFFSGMSTLSPWRNVFQSLPSRIHSKILSTAEMEVKYKSSILTSQIWNAVVITMYREHLLSVDQVQKLIYHQIPNESDGSTALKSPSFFLFQNDNSRQDCNFFVPGSEAERRITFFAQSLSTTISEPIPVEAMPTFTVLIPHYSEKILLTISEIIKEYPNSKVTQLEYLKHLSPHEWEYFVRDTKILVHDKEKGQKGENEEAEPANEAQNKAEVERDFLDNKVNEIPLYCVGYKSSAPEFTLRTRIWSSLRTQTLYRTVSGFMSYHRAIKLLHKVENPEMIELFGGSSNADHYLSEIAKKKFRMLVSMQRFQNLSSAERKDVTVMLETFPEVHIATLEEEHDDEANETKYYSVLYHGLDKKKNLRRVYKILLPGDPILGDGKSDNQNMSLIFYRGEYIEVIDSNQDNYLEECLKIRSVLAEFEELAAYPRNPYVPAVRYSGKSPVAILGAREYIFSENTGILGDVAAAKEQTFGTLFARTLSEIGGKLHYGHPDFLNAIFMTTRGGISKAQKGLHLNEDIYAGMTAILRGGRIKHCDYFQCGKGRDLGFGSILNFTSKIGGGMGEQMLSREYHYLGTQLPLDRFLSFYYAHPGFHLNNLFIIFSLHVFMLVLVNLGSMAHESILCAYDKDLPITDLQIPVGCSNLQPVLDWVTRYVLSIFICFFISFLPLVLHELSERGAWKAVSRLFFHFISLSPLFEVFVCQIYSNSLKSDLVFGGAKYIATGRGFAITRVPFTMLYSTYATTSIYSGFRLFLLLLFGTVTMKKPAIAWFWITLISMCLSPFMFNPHQFSWTDFFLDYRDFVRWLGRGTSRWHKNSWVGFTRISRSRITGYKKRKFEDSENGSLNISHRAPFGNTFFAEVVIPFFHACFIFSAYTYINAQNGVADYKLVNSVLRLLILVFLPLALNIMVLIVLFPIAIIASPLCGLCCSRFPTFLAALSHCLSVIFHCFLFPVIFYLEGWNFSRSLCALTCVINVQRVIFQAIKLLFLSRELKEDYANRSWWSGKWIQGRFGRHIITQPLREFPVKIVEMSLFAADFYISHVLFLFLTPFLFIPYIDNIHSSLLMWIRPSKHLHGKLNTIAQSRRRRMKAAKYGLLYFLVVAFLSSIVVAPVVVSQNRKISEELNKVLNIKDSLGLIQPNYQNNNDTGDSAPASVPRVKPPPVTWKTHWI